MKEIILGLFAFGAFMMIIGVVLAMGAYGSSNVVIQWVHHPFATGVFGVGLAAFCLALTGWMAVGNDKS